MPVALTSGRSRTCRKKCNPYHKKILHVIHLHWSRKHWTKLEAIASAQSSDWSNIYPPTLPSTDLFESFASNSDSIFLRDCVCLDGGLDYLKIILEISLLKSKFGYDVIDFMTRFQVYIFEILELFWKLAFFKQKDCNLLKIYRLTKSTIKNVLNCHFKMF